MSLFRITIHAGTPAKFDPNPLTAYVNDSVFWYNGDSVNHWPAPCVNNKPCDGSDPTAVNPKGWLKHQIAPDSVSSQISFDPPGNYTLYYVCALHPHETGQIKVLPAKKAAFAGKTKKGPYGGKTKKGAFAGETKKGAFAVETKKGALASTTKKGAFGKTTK
jgi:plastocyanin